MRCSAVFLLSAILLGSPGLAQQISANAVALDCTATFAAPIGTSIGPGAAMGFLRWQTNPGCDWAISVGVDWFSFSQKIPDQAGYFVDTEMNAGLVAGKGSGVLPFSVTANTSAGPRFVTLQFVGDVSASFTINQEGQDSSRPSIVSFSPTQDSGFSQTFALQIFDASGYQSVAAANVVFDTFPSTGACGVRFFQTGGQGYLTLLSDDGSSYLQAMPLPGTGTVANSRCQVSAANSSFSESRNNAALNIALTFLPGFAGDKLVFANATDAGNSSSPVNEIGQWTVGPSNSLHVSLPNPVYFTYSVGDQAFSQSGFTATDLSQSITAQTSTLSGGSWLTAIVYAPNALPPLLVKADPAGLPVGTYTGTVAISAPGAQTVNVPVSMTVTPPSILEASAKLLQINVPSFCPSPSPATVAITSSGESVPISLSVSGSPDIRFSLDQAVTPAILTINVNTTGAYPGSSLGANVIVSSPGQKNLTIFFYVQLTLPPPLFYNLSPVKITLGVTPGNTQSQTVPVSSYACFGPPTFTTTVSMNPPGAWLSAYTSGLMTGQTFHDTGLPVDTTNLTVSVNANGLAPGIYFGSVNASDGHGLTPPEGITATVYAQPQLTVTPASLAFNHQTPATTPAPQTIQVATPGTPGSASSLPYTVSVSQGANTVQCGMNWLAAVPAGGTTTGTSLGVPVTVSYNTAGLSGGSYVCSGVVTVAIPGTAIAPVSVPVSLSVTTATAFFTGEVSLGSGFDYLQFPNGNLFGYYSLQSYPILYHNDLGFESFVDAHDGNTGAYLYDFASGHWFYTSPNLFPYLYDFALKTWIYYLPDTKNPGHYTTNPRYFSNLTTALIFTM